jgi:hypothetical protein
LYVPGVDRCVCGAQIHHGEQAGAVDHVNAVLIDEVSGKAISQQRRSAGALPEEGDVRLQSRTGPSYSIGRRKWLKAQSAAADPCRRATLSA